VTLRRRGTAPFVRQLGRRAADAGTAIVVATHNREVIKHLDRVLAMADGRLEERPRS
jgi:ABC-type lipoprotein export system ATPase subunit